MALSDYLPLALQASSTILSAGSQLVRGEAYRTIAARRKAALDFEAKQLDVEAEQASGIGMRGAADEVRKAKLVQSATLARAAASGAGASDPTVMGIIARTGGEGAYRSALAMFEGESQARLDRLRAAGARYEGDIGVADSETAARQTRQAAGSTLLSGALRAASLYDKYWTGPRKDSDSATTETATTPASAPASGSWLDAGTEIYDGTA